MNRQFKDFLEAKEKLERAGLYKGLVAFGSARIDMEDGHIKEIEEIADLCAKRILEKGKKISFITGGGPSVMTAWLKGAHREGIQTSGLFMQLMKEKVLNPYAIPEISCEVETLESRKAILFEYAKCAIIFKGGFGTLDEVFSMLTLIRTIWSSRFCAMRSWTAKRILFPPTITLRSCPDTRPRRPRQCWNLQSSTRAWAAASFTTSTITAMAGSTSQSPSLPI